LKHHNIVFDDVKCTYISSYVVIPFTGRCDLIQTLTKVYTVKESLKKTHCNMLL